MSDLKNVTKIICFLLKVKKHVCIKKKMLNLHWVARLYAKVHVWPSGESICQWILVGALLGASK